jgi:hypothetical protein
MTISQQISELRNLAPAQLAERYESLFGKTPRNKNRAWLFRQVAWKLQERELGGLNERARSRLDELIARVDLPLATPPRPKPTPARPDSNTPMAGTVLTRRWHDQDIRVAVRDDGFEWNGVLYKSLSACAKAVTGAAWNGRLFFGLTNRRSAS